MMMMKNWPKKKKKCLEHNFCIFLFGQSSNDKISVFFVLFCLFAWIEQFKLKYKSINRLNYYCYKKVFFLFLVACFFVCVINQNLLFNNNQKKKTLNIRMHIDEWSFGQKNKTKQTDCLFLLNFQFTIFYACNVRIIKRIKIKKMIKRNKKRNSGHRGHTHTH